MTHEERVIALLQRMADTLDEIKGLLGQKPVRAEGNGPAAKQGDKRAGGAPSGQEPQGNPEEFSPSLDDLKNFFDKEFGREETEDDLKPLLRWPKRK